MRLRGEMNKTIETTWEELVPIARILNEVCHGIAMDNFEEEVGYNYDEIYILLKKIKNLKSLDRKQSISLSLTDREMGIIKASYREVLKQIEDWEFQIRIGLTISEVDQILNQKFE